MEWWLILANSSCQAGIPKAHKGGRCIPAWLQFIFSAIYLLPCLCFSNFADSRGLQLDLIKIEGTFCQLQQSILFTEKIHIHIFYLSFQMLFPKLPKRKSHSLGFCVQNNIFHNIICHEIVNKCVMKLHWWVVMKSLDPTNPKFCSKFDSIQI